MSNAWHWFVVLGTVGSIVALLVLLVSNRKTSGQETTGHEYDGIEEYDNPMPMWWIGLFVGSIIFAVGYLAYYPGMGNFDGAGEWTSVNQWQGQVDAHESRFAPFYAQLSKLEPQAIIKDERARRAGRRLFINYCSTCHGVNAAGSFGFPNLTDEQWIWGDDFAAVKTTITQGRVATMPGWGPALGDKGVTEVVEYVLKLAGRDNDQTLAQAGEGHYQTYCVACHGPQGGGNPALGSPNLTNDIWLYGGSREQIAFNVRHGRNGNMPAQVTLLGEDRVHLLAAYVMSLRNDE